MVLIVLIMSLWFTTLFPVPADIADTGFLILAFRVVHLLGSGIFPVLTALSCQIIYSPLKISFCQEASSFPSLPTEILIHVVI